jgi:hypothetical protein
MRDFGCPEEKINGSSKILTFAAAGISLISHGGIIQSALFCLRSEEGEIAEYQGSLLCQISSHDSRSVVQSKVGAQSSYSEHISTGDLSGYRDEYQIDGLFYRFAFDDNDTLRLVSVGMDSAHPRRVVTAEVEELINSLSMEAIQVLEHAKLEARSVGRTEIKEIEFLIALCTNPDSKTASCLMSQGISSTLLRAEARKQRETSPDLDDSEKSIGLEALAILKAAQAVSVSRGHHLINSEDLLVSILDADLAGARMLTTLGVDTRILTQCLSVEDQSP